MAALLSWDGLLGAVLLFSMVLGAWRGLVYEVLSLIVWLAAFAIAQWGALAMARHLPLSGAGEAVRYAAGFVLVFVAAVFLGGLLASLLSRLVCAVGLRPVDRVMGAMFGVLRGYVLLLVVIAMVSMTPWNNAPDWRDSSGVQWGQAALALLKPLLPQAFGKYLPSS